MVPLPGVSARRDHPLRRRLSEQINQVSILQRFAAGRMEDINEKMLSENMYTFDIPDPDLMIRTSGELRLSGFLIWQLAYTELLFVDKYWPDFEEKDLDMSIEEYQKRNRNFGGN